MPRDRIDINKDIMPYGYDIAFGDTVYTLMFNYNARRDLFSVNLVLDDEVICAGERVVYGRPLFDDSYTVGRYPPITIVPFDESGTTQEAVFATVGETVLLTIDDGAAGKDEGEV